MPPFVFYSKPFKIMFNATTQITTAQIDKITDIIFILPSPNI